MVLSRIKSITCDRWKPTPVISGNRHVCAHQSTGCLFQMDSASIPITIQHQLQKAQRCGGVGQKRVDFKYRSGSGQHGGTPYLSPPFVKEGGKETFAASARIYARLGKSGHSTLPSSMAKRCILRDLVFNPALLKRYRI